MALCDRLPHPNNLSKIGPERCFCATIIRFQQVDDDAIGLQVLCMRSQMELHSIPYERHTAFPAKPLPLDVETSMEAVRLRSWSRCLEMGSNSRIAQSCRSTWPEVRYQIRR